MNILAEILTLSKGDPRGVLCWASILWVFIVVCLYAPNPIFGSCTCAVIFLICCVGLGDSGAGGPGMQYTPNKAFIANRSQTKFLERNYCNINHPDCIFHVRDMGTSTPLDNELLFVPAEEMVVIDGIRCMKSTRKQVDMFGEDGYLYGKTFDPVNLAVEHGGHGVDPRLYHPASLIYIFGLAGLPAILGGGFIANKIRS